MDNLYVTLPAFYVTATALGITGQFMRGLLGLIKRHREFGEFAFNPTFLP